MPIRSLIANCIFSLLLYFINGFLGKLKTSSWIPFEYSSFEFNSIEDEKFSENFIQPIVHPTIYLALVCAILQENELGNLAGLARNPHRADSMHTQLSREIATSPFV